MKKYLSLGLLVLVFSVGVSCQNNSEKINKESLSIVEMLYEAELKQFPIPLPPDSLNGKMNQGNEGKEIRYAIAPMNNTGVEKGNDLPMMFEEVVSQQSAKFEAKNLTELKLKDSKGNPIPVVSYLKDSKVQDVSKSNQVTGILFLSDIVFNENFTVAVLTFGSYIHELAGQTSMLGLEMKNGKWEITFSKVLSES